MKTLETQTKELSQRKQSAARHKTKLAQKKIDRRERRKVSELMKGVNYGSSRCINMTEVQRIVADNKELFISSAAA